MPLSATDPLKHPNPKAQLTFFPGAFPFLFWTNSQQQKQEKPPQKTSAQKDPQQTPPRKPKNTTHLNKKKPKKEKMVNQTT